MAVQHENQVRFPARDEIGSALGAQTCLIDDKVELHFLRLDLKPAIIAGLLPLLDCEERVRAARYIFERDRSRFVVARARLRQLLAVRLGVEPEVIEFEYGKQGKPALQQSYAKSNLRFNVSHSADLAVYAFSYGREVGVDLEAVCAMPDADDLAERFFSTRENLCYRRLDPGNKPRGFFNCWTRKEAFVKALGEGLSFPLDSFDVSLVPGDTAKILRHGDLSGEGCGWRLADIPNLPAGYAGAVVFEERKPNIAPAYPQLSDRFAGKH